LKKKKQERKKRNKKEGAGIEFAAAIDDLEQRCAVAPALIDWLEKRDFVEYSALPRELRCACSRPWITTFSGTRRSPCP
jgi:hypothetical protein